MESDESVRNDTFEAALWRLARSRRDDDAWRLLHEELWPRLIAISFRVLRGSQTVALFAASEVLSRLFHDARFADFREYPNAFRSFAMAACRAVSLLYLSELNKEARSPSMLMRKIPMQFDLLARFSLRVDDKQRPFLDLLLEGLTLSEVVQRLGMTQSASVLLILGLRNQLARLLRER